MKDPVNSKQVKLVIGLLLVFLFSLIFSLYREYKHLSRVEEITSYKSLIDNLRHKKPLTAQDVDIIQSWMTFNYLNIIFHLPPEYFKGYLNITDSRYPNVSLGKYAKSQKNDSNIFIGAVKKSITDYFAK